MSLKDLTRDRSSYLDLMFKKTCFFFPNSGIAIALIFANAILDWDPFPSAIKMETGAIHPCNSFFASLAA